MQDFQNYINSLKQKQYATIIHSTEYKNLLSDMCSRIISKAKIAPNEATIENYFDCELFSFFREVFSPLGFEYQPVKEASISTSRHITKGRADTAIGALVIEFKQPSTLSNTKLQQKALSQIKEYLLGMELTSELVGLVTDGTRACFVIRSETGVREEKFSKLSFEHLDRLIKTIIHLKLTALSSQNLVESFCNPPKNDGIAFLLMKELYNNLSDKMTPKTQMLFNEWKELFNLSHDDVSQQQAIIDRRISLENILGDKISEADKEYLALFALQTAYVIIVKIVAYRIASIARYNSSLIDFEILSTLDENALRQQLISLEDGAVFRNYGILNLLEGDFFSWYISKDQWSFQIAQSISKIFQVLSLYSDSAVLNTREKSSDFFKELYQNMMPVAVRHSLGEYYTKRWMAQKVIDEALSLTQKNEWKGLDPCCGSGTFITVMIDKVLQETKDFDKPTQLSAVLSRVKGIDLNPVAVLTARVNYFINIAHLLMDCEELEIPVYLGDSSYVPTKKVYDGVLCLEYTINTLLAPIDILLPSSMVQDSKLFSQTMTEIEIYIKNLDETKVYSCLEKLVNKNDLTDNIKMQIHKLSSVLVDLERRNWDGIWARIITNYLTTANLGKFDVIVGNPPWVDWKSLPSGYRNKIKSLCISRKLFSGDRRTGGINLNICALISNVVAENWLSDKGILGFLMPEPLIFQQSYEGFRNLYLSDNSRLYIKKLVNWTRAGRPFNPVTQKFLTYYITKDYVDYNSGVDVDWYILKKKKNYNEKEDIIFDDFFDKKSSIAATCHNTKNAFSYIDSRQQLEQFKLITGESFYIGREGIEFYPQEMMIFELSGLPAAKNCISLKNIQVPKSKYRIPQNIELLESEFLHPLIKGVDITPFHIEEPKYIVPFPYTRDDNKLPIPIDELSLKAPKLASFYQKYKDIILSQTSYNERIIGKQGAFYALARVGAYSFAENYVVFRDNTLWGAAVTSTIDTKWGGIKRPLFQNHAVSICEDLNGNFITYNEAHFICGIMNTSIASNYVMKSSDSRSFPIRLRIYIPKYNPNDVIHQEISNLSMKAHQKYNSPNDIKEIIEKLDSLYLKILKKMK